MLDEGNYDNCVLKEAVTTESQGGNPMLVLTFDVGGGTTRSVRFMLNDGDKGKDGKTNLERSGEQLTRIGFNGDFKDPKFNESLYTGGTKLRCKHGEYNGNPQEEWSLGFSYDQAPESSLDSLSRNWRARFGSSPKPAGGAKPAPTPSRTPPARTPPKKANDPLDPVDVTDMDSAFKFAVDRNPKLSDDRWAASIGEHVKKFKVKEEAFTEQHWQAVAVDCAIPF